ncbi:MAG: iron-sulfur cluster repair protein YtfE [Bacteriovoracaceae bacterium]
MKYPETSLAELAINVPMASELFRRHRLDFCCGGTVTLREACEQKKLALDAIVNELSALAEKKMPESDLAPQELTGYIVQRYHDDLRKRIPELISLAGKVTTVHAGHPECPKGLTELLTLIQEELFAHMMKEENVLFPMINAGKGAFAVMPVKVMMMEHEHHGQQLEELHHVAHDFVPPLDACASWRTLYKGLQALEAELMEHIHLENHVLFPKILTSK